MNALDLRRREDCDLDLVALGEVMLRFDPGEHRIRGARTFAVWEGGGEYNVARGLRRCFGARTAIVTALVDNEIGRLVEDLVLQGGVDTSRIRWTRSDGVGRNARNGLNFTERGFGVRPALGVSDRGHTAVAQLRPGDVDWDTVFGDGVRWFHTGGVFAGLSSTTPAVAEEAMAAARRHGTVVSYDINYRPSLWQDAGGPEAATEVNRRLAAQADVLIGNEGHFSGLLGLDLDRPTGRGLPIGRVVDATVAAFPQLRVVAATSRSARSASLTDWGAVGWADGVLTEARLRHDLAVLDRVGGGDGFVAGLAYGLMEHHDLGIALEYGTAHGALAMTTPGDASMATLAEVEALMRGTDAGTSR